MKRLFIPESKTEENVMIIPGTDGQKMSKSYGNTINIFSDESIKKTSNANCNRFYSSRGTQRP